MLISVIIPAYNRAACIRRALESVKAQGIAGIEVILGDDASTDSTVELAQTIFPDLKVARLSTNQGASAARNAALRLAQGDFIAFLDSDDEWVPGKLHQQVGFLRDYPEVGLVGCGHTLLCRDGSVEDYSGVNPADWRLELHLAESFHGASTSVVRRDALKAAGLFDERLRVLEDWDWLLRIAQVSRIHVLPEKLAVIHENNPSDPEETIRSLGLFLKKHRGEFLLHGRSHAARVFSQHYENTGRNLIRHGRLWRGVAYFLRSFREDPLRNPLLPCALPVAVCDSIFSTGMLARLLESRSRRRLT